MNIIKLAGKSLTTGSKRRIKKLILKNIYFDRFVNTYDSWIIKNFPDVLDLERYKEDIKNFRYKPLISITIPVYNTPEEFLHECIQSVLTQCYENWEIILVDDASPDAGVRKIIKEYAKNDKRIKYKFLKQNHHIAGATNEAIKMSSGEFVGLFDHDDILWPNALYEVVKALNKDDTIDFMYTDEDKIVEVKSRHAEPFFKPDWSPYLLRTCNYITHFSVFKRELLDKVGYESGDYNGAQDWEMIMRATRQANNIHHIPKILYSWRVHDNSTAKDMGSKPYVMAAQKATIEDDMVARGYSKTNFRVDQDKNFFAFWKTAVDVGNPKVSVIVTSRLQSMLIARKTSYKNCEYVVAKSYKDGFHKSTGDYVVFIEPAIRMKTKNWIQSLLNSASQDDVGVAGGLTLYSNKGYIYSAGIAVNQDDKLVHVLSGGVEADHAKTLTRTVYIQTRRNTTAIGSCVMVKRDRVASYAFKSDTLYTRTEQLIMLSLWLIDKGFNNVYDPSVINMINTKYQERKKRGNEGYEESYKDKEIALITKTGKYKSTLKKRYFYDDLVSYPDVD